MKKKPIRGYERRYKKKKKKKDDKMPSPSKIVPVDYEGGDRDSTQTPGSSLPASFIPAPFGHPENSFGSSMKFVKEAQDSDEIKRILREIKDTEEEDSPEDIQRAIDLLEKDRFAVIRMQDQFAMGQDVGHSTAELSGIIESIDEDMSALRKRQQFKQEAPSPEDLNQMFKFERLKALIKQAKKKTYGFDIDEVLCAMHSTIIEMAREYVEIPNDIMWDYKKLKDIPGVGEEIQDKVFAHLTDNQQLLIDMPQVPGAIEKVNSLHDAGHRIVLITARGKGWDEGTKGWLEKNQVKYDKLITGANEKSEAVEEEGVEIFIDDTVGRLDEIDASTDARVYRFDTPWEDSEQFVVLDNWDKFDETVKAEIKGFTKQAAPRWTPQQTERLKCLYLKWRDRGYPHHVIYKAAAQLLGRSFLATKQKLESMYGCDEELAPMKFEHWDQNKIDQTIQDLYCGGQPISRLSLPSILMYQITNHALPKAETRGFPVFYDSFDHAMANNVLKIGFEREGCNLLQDRPITTFEQALQYYRRQEKQAHSWSRDEILALLRDAHVVGLPLTHSFFKSHSDIYKPLLGMNRTLEGLRDSIKRSGDNWSDLVIEAAPEYIDLYTDNGRLSQSTEEIRIRRFLELNSIPFKVATIEDKFEVNIPELQELGYRNFVPDFFILDEKGDTRAVVEVFGSIADSQAANTAEIYREKRTAKEQFYQTLPHTFIAINNNTDGIDLTDEILKDKFHQFLEGE